MKNTNKTIVLENGEEMYLHMENGELFLHYEGEDAYYHASFFHKGIFPYKIKSIINKK